MIYHSFVYDTSQDNIMHILDENKRKGILNYFYVIVTSLKQPLREHILIFIFAKQKFETQSEFLSFYINLDV